MAYIKQNFYDGQVLEAEHLNKMEDELELLSNSTHNTDADSHEDIRNLIQGLTSRLNTLADSDDETLDQLSELVSYIKSNKGLIEEVTTSKINVLDIVDNLTTNVSNKPLSAAQGVALKTLIDAIIVPTKVSELENDSNFLTQHQSLAEYVKTVDLGALAKKDEETDPTVPTWAKQPSKPTYTAKDVGAISTDELQSVANEILTQAKSNGEFDGKDGISATHEWNGTTLTITSASGTSSADLKGGTGDPGYTPVKSVDYWTEADQEEIIQQVIAALGTPVFGRVDVNNNITLTAVLADGTYNLWLEDKDGKVSHICTYNHAYTSAPTYTNLFVANTCTLNKRGNSSGTTTDCDGIFITDYIDIGNVMSSGGVNQLHYKGMYFDVNGLTNAQGEVYSYLNYYDANKTHLGHVSMRTVGDTLTDAGDYVITLNDEMTTARYIRVSAAVSPKQTGTLPALTGKDQLTSIIITLNETINNEGDITNILLQAIDNERKPYNDGKGYKEGYRLNSTGTETEQADMCITGFIPVKWGDDIYLSGITMNVTDTTTCKYIYVNLYTPELESVGRITANNDAWPAVGTSMEIDADGNVKRFTIDSTNFVYVSNTNVGYMRLSAQDINSNSIIATEPIEKDSIINMLTQAINADGTLYNGGQGWKAGTRLNSSGVESTSNASDLEVTGFIPVKNGDIVYMSGVKMNAGTYANQTYWWLYDASFNPLMNGSGNGRYRLFSQYGDKMDSHKSQGKIDMDADGNITMFQIESDVFYTGSNLPDMSNAAYLRISCEEITDQSIITINQPIPETESIINQIPLSTDTDGSIYNGVGYKQDVRYSGSGKAEVSYSGAYLSGYIPVIEGDIVYLKNITMSNQGDGNYCVVQYFSAYDSFLYIYQQANIPNAVWDDNNNLTQFTAAVTGYIRLTSSYIGEDSIVTINQPIEKDGITNMIPQAINADGTLYNGGQGWKTDTRLGSNGAESTQDANGMEVTGFIPVSFGDTLYFKDVEIVLGGTNSDKCYFTAYDSSFAKIANWRADGDSDNVAFKFDENSNVVSVTFVNGSKWSASIDAVAYFRCSATEITDQSIITINQPIPEIESIINQIPLSINTDGTQYVGANGEDGYKMGYRLNSSGEEASAAAFGVTGFIPVKAKDVIYFKNVNFTPGVESNGGGNYIAVYDTTFTKIESSKSTNVTADHYLYKPVETYADSGLIKSISLLDSTRDYGYLRVSATGLNADSIITINQPISETINIPLNFELGVKLSKTDNTYTTVSTDHMTASDTYAASQYIDLDTNSEYKVGLTHSNYKSLSLCFFDANNNFVAYQSDVISGPHNETATAMEHTIVIPDGATKVRLRLYVPINQYNSANFALSRAAAWMTKTG